MFLKRTPATSGGICESEGAEKAIRDYLGNSYSHNMNEWDKLNIYRWNSFPSLVFFRAIEPNSFMHDRGSNVIGGYLDKDNEVTIVLDRMHYEKQSKAEDVIKILAASLEEVYPSNAKDLPPVEDLVGLVECLYIGTSCSLVKDQRSVAHVVEIDKEEGSNGTEPKVWRNEDGAIVLSYSYTTSSMRGRFVTNTSLVFK